MFTFDHSNKTVLNTHEVPPPNDDTIVYTLNRRDAETLNITNEDTLLVLLTTGERSILSQPTAIVEDTTYEFRIEKPRHDKLGVTQEDVVTSRVTNLDAFDSLSLSTDELVMVPHEPVYGTETDATDGTWLFINQYKLNYNETDERVAGRVHIPKTPYRDYLAFNDTGEYKFKVTNNNIAHEFERHLIDNGHGVTIPSDTLESLDVTKTNRTVDLWVHTTSLTDTPTNPDKQLPETETHKSDADTHAVETVRNKNFDPIEEPDTPISPPPTEPASVPLNTFTDPDNINARIDTDLTPVVLLDDEERLQENWVGHYMRPNGDLVCEKPYTDAVEDPAGRHYNQVCIACAVKQPGALRDRDLSQLLNNTLGTNLSDEAPFLLDKENAAKALVNALKLDHPDH